MPTAEDEKERELTKRIRLLEGNRRSYAGDTKTQIQKQQDTVSTLRKENKKQKEELKTVEDTSGLSTRYQSDLGNREDTYEMIQRKIEIEMRKLREYENKSAEYVAQVANKRKERSVTMGGINATQENHQTVDKQVKVLENRLDQALIKFNEGLSHNKDLREQIDNLRRERVVFDGIYRKLEKELHEKKKQMAEIIEKSNLYYEDRDACGLELRHLRESAEKDIQQYERHFEELDLMLEANKNLELSIKNMRTQTKSPKPDDDPNASRKKKQDTRTKQEIEQDQEQRAFNYQEIVDQLKEATGIQDMEVLLQKFVSAEEQNFSMYNFANELNSENERLAEEIAQAKEFTVLEHGDPARSKQLKTLEEELSKAESLAETLNDSTVQAKKRIEELQGVIQEVFNKVGYTGGADVGATECTESSMMMFLGMIEERANEILAAYHVVKVSESQSKARLREEERRQAKERRLQERQNRREQGEDVPDEDDEEEAADGAAAAPGRTNFLGGGPAVPVGSTNLSKVVEMKLPAAADSFGNDYAEDGEDERPFSQEELRQQTEARMARQMNRDDRTDKSKKKHKDKHRRGA
ncbi:Outer dynein arm protein 1 [Diplonema papillatum]|nr:Outer dynein arm protein 1 [Diplonema papillatum]